MTISIGNYDKILRNLTGISLYKIISKGWEINFLFWKIWYKLITNSLRMNINFWKISCIKYVKISKKLILTAEYLVWELYQNLTKGMTWDLLMFVCEVISKSLWNKHRFSKVSMTTYIRIFMNYHWFLNDSVESWVKAFMKFELIFECFYWKVG